MILLIISQPIKKRSFQNKTNCPLLFFLQRLRTHRTARRGQDRKGSTPESGRANPIESLVAEYRSLPQRRQEIPNPRAANQN